jgi:hypothetical protein
MTYRDLSRYFEQARVARIEISVRHEQRWLFEMEQIWRTGEPGS